MWHKKSEIFSLCPHPISSLIMVSNSSRKKVSENWYHQYMWEMLNLRAALSNKRVTYIHRVTFLPLFFLRNLKSSCGMFCTYVRPFSHEDTFMYRDGSPKVCILFASHARRAHPCHYLIIHTCGRINRLTLNTEGILSSRLAKDICTLTQQILYRLLYR